MRVSNKRDVDDEQQVPPPFPVYLVEAYEAMLRHARTYDETDDALPLVRGLGVGCEALSRLAEDSQFWGLVNSLASASSDDEGIGSDDDALDEVVEVERHLLTQVGMAPRYVALLLESADVAANAFRAARGSGDQVRLRDAAKTLREQIRALAAETCREWENNRRALQPVSTPSGPRHAPAEVSRPGRLRRLLKRGALVVGGAIMIGVDGVAAAHLVIPPNVALWSGDIGAGLVVAGVVGQSSG